MKIVLLLLLLLVATGNARECLLGCSKEKRDFFELECAPAKFQCPGGQFSRCFDRDFGDQRACDETFGQPTCYSHRDIQSCSDGLFFKERKRCCLFLTNKPTSFPTVEPTESPSLSPTIGQDSINELYITYPDGIIPQVSKFSTDTADPFYLDDPSVYFDPSRVALGLTQKRFIYSPVGFFVNVTQTSSFIEGLVVNRNSSRFGLTDFDFPPLTFDEAYHYIEKRPIDNNDQSRYIERHFGFTNRNNEKRVRDSADQYCMLDLAVIPTDYPLSTQEICEKIPRCAGYIPGRCLVSVKVFREALLAGAELPDYVYIEKELRHLVFRWIEESPLFAVIVGIAIFAVQLLYLLREETGVGAWFYDSFKDLKRKVSKHKYTRL